MAAILTSVLSLPVVAGFDVSGLAKAAFVGEAVLWFATTVAAYVHIRAGRVERHRAWMIRSFALAAFFITFSVWDPATAARPIPTATVFALAAVLGWLVNPATAETG